MKSDSEVNLAIEKYADTVRRICFIHLKNDADTEDIFQTVFIKYFFYEKNFESNEHEKAWFIRVTINACKDLLKSFHRKTVHLEDNITENTLKEHIEKSELTEIVLSLKKKIQRRCLLILLRRISGQ